MLVFLSMIENEEERQYIEKIYNENYLNLKMKAKSIIKDESLAQDSVQDVFLKICDKLLDHFLSLSPDDQLKYLIICVKNSALAKYNKRKRIMSLTSTEENDGMEYEILDPTANVEEIVLNNELKAKLRECIDSLDEIYRDVIILRFQMHLKCKEVAEVLYITEDTVKQRIKRAKETLKKKGGKELYGLFN